MLCCLRGCLNGFSLNSNLSNMQKENAIRLDTTFMGYEVVIIKDGERVCGSGATLGNAPLVQSKSYFEVKIQQAGCWSIGLATKNTNLNVTQGGLDEHSWGLSHDGVVRHNKQLLYKLVDDGDTRKIPQEGDVVGVSYDHVQLKFYLNGKELEGSVSNCKGTLYPALYVDDGSILDVVFEKFTYPLGNGFEQIMIEQSLL